MEGDKQMTNTNRVFNFSAGPSMLPLDVIEDAAANLSNYKGCGQSVMEMSHRSKEFGKIIEEAEADLRDLMHIPENYKVLFLQGGGTLQFAMVPLNLLRASKKADYVVAGSWGKKARLLTRSTAKFPTFAAICWRSVQRSHLIPQARNILQACM